MSRKDYELIAQALKDAADDHRRGGRNEAAYGIEDAALVLARRIEAVNGMFNREKFLRACGVSGTVIG